MRQLNLFGQASEGATKSAKATRKDPYQAITDKIVAAMQQGVCPWRMPWNGGGAGYVSHSTGRPYSFLNTILLMIDGKNPGEFLTFKQVKDAGGSVNKGAKSTTIYFYKRLHFEIDAVDEQGNIELDEDGNPIKLQANPICLKGYNVFHISDTTGVKPKHQGEFTPSAAEPIEAAEQIVSAYYGETGAPSLNIEFSGRAFYSPTTDSVTVPQLAQFENPAEYYSTLFHETVHSTGHESRLGRHKVNKAMHFGSNDYSREELVAEIGAAYLCNRAGIDNQEAFDNSVAYLQGWIKQLTNRPKQFAIAAAQAEKAARYILGERPSE